MTSPAHTRAPANRRPAAGDWATLRAQVRGRVFLPDEAGYEQARQVADPRFALVRPAGVVSCADEQDVRAAVEFARRHRLTPHPRSGGHSYTGYSTGSGLVIDVSAMKDVSVEGSEARVGAGATSGEVTQALDEHDRILPVGTCPGVGIAGLTLGGGIGTVGRAYGLTLDNLREATVVLADAGLVTCGPDSHPDLFFALRGAGTGNFGVVTSLVFDTHPAPEVCTFLLDWAPGRASQAILGWQEWALALPDQMFTQVRLLTKPAHVRVIAVWCGPPGEGVPLVERLITVLGKPDTVRSHRSRYAPSIEFLKKQKLFDGGGQAPFIYTEDHQLFRPLPPKAVDVLVSKMIEASDSTRLAALERQGGALGRTPGTAWAHRACLFGSWYQAVIPPAAGLAAVLAARDWVAGLWHALRPWASGHSYQNHLSPRRPDWARAYYGEHLDRLRAVKARYDPDDLFHHPHGLHHQGLRGR
ncbi:FAD-binding oxidoreductase [Nonomuraea jabiensis]|uniref:FAD/FMN-containing dehydrogenase n=1 Tax=Nonomuraea jabiensis TaxID=882448 RepID=A0A7W9L9E1_9ACTN|nr:FAD-binding oxidoreductase [Nonomuraea jabiensis]MBB5775393.1 FAD/FMN-containing dehydrogenase [Nonomuraea jabiensis]